MSDLSRSLVDAAAEVIANRNRRAWAHSDDVQYRLEGRDAVAAVLETLAADLPPAWTGLPEKLRGLAAEVKEERP